MNTPGRLHRTFQSGVVVLSGLIDDDVFISGFSNLRLGGIVHQRAGELLDEVLQVVNAVNGTRPDEVRDHPRQPGTHFRVRPVKG